MVDDGKDAPLSKSPRRRAAGKNAPARSLAKRGRRSKTDKASPPAETNAGTVIFGLHAATFALNNPKRRITAIYATDNALHRLGDAVQARQDMVIRTTPRDLDKRLGPETVHQGVLIEVEPLEPASLATIAQTALATSQPAIILDQVTDPHNVGAVLRSTAVFGAAGLVMTHRHSPPLGGALAKAASGALELMTVCLVRNLADAIAQLQAAGLLVIGLDAEDTDFLEDALPNGNVPYALALGAESKGLRALTRQSCNRLCRIGGDGPISSLNVSNAAAVALHLSAMRRRGRSSD